jgi:PAT family beta-lactamase induction signal transducer AmpG
VLLYKAGEGIADSIFRPMLVDAGLGLPEISLYVNTYGAGAALLGPVLAGALVRYIGVQRAIVLLVVLRVFPLAGELAIALGSHAHDFIIAVTLLEHLVGSAITTVTFALMMSVVDPRIGATQFTTLATVEVLGKMLIGWLAGPMGDLLGVATTYAIALVFTLAFAYYGPILSRGALAARRP